MSTIINPTNINIYGINYFINKFDNEKSVDLINLEVLKETFKVDYYYDSEENEVVTTSLPAFTKLSYNSKESIGDSKLITNYNRPPLGPIENFCYCSFCNNLSPFYHQEDCQNPENKSLFLTIEGFYYYVIQNPNYSGELESIKEKWVNNELKQEDLNKILLIPNTVKTNKDSKKIKLDNTFTNIQYYDIIKIRGPSKLAYTTATEKFSNTIILSYEYANFESGNLGNSEESETEKSKKVSKTSIRISKNGLINLINVPANEEQQLILFTEITNRIDVESVNMDTFNELASEYLETDSELEKYEIIKDISYIHSLNSQFNLWPIKNKYVLNFEKLSNLISPYDSSGRLITSDYTEIIEQNGLQIIKLKYGSSTLKIINWEYSIGKETRIQTTTREEIKCIILPVPGIKISLLLHKYGTFQLSMSYCNTKDIRNNICSQYVSPSEIDLNKKYFEEVKNIFSGIISENVDSVVSLNLSFSEEDSKQAKNTVSGNAPPKKPGTTTEVCRSKDPRPGFPSLRPIPYSFKGKCAETRQVMDPRGVLGSDGLYYPCCSAKTSVTETEIKKYLINGFPRNEYEAEEFGVNQYNDDKSGILVPGSTNIGAITKALIRGQYRPIEIIGYPGKGKAPVKPKKFIVKILETEELVTIDRENLLRDSRYFPGLKSFNKNQLIKCINNSLLTGTSDSDSTIKLVNVENLSEIRELIGNLSIGNLNNINNNSLNYLDFDIFTEIKFYVASVPSVPNNSENYYLYINGSNTYLVNNYGSKINFELEQQITDKIVFNGFYSKELNKYYIFDILYYDKYSIKNSINNSITFSEKIELFDELEANIINFENNMEILEFKENIIKSSAEFIIEESDISLIFIPEKMTHSYKVWSEIENEKNEKNKKVILQIIKRNKNYYSLGFDNKLLSNLPIGDITFSNIFIPKKFIEENMLKLGDYIEFEFDFNLQTEEISTRILNPIAKKDKPKYDYSFVVNRILEILNPIRPSFFLNNRLETDYVWYLPEDSILKYIDDKLPLIKI